MKKCPNCSSVNQDSDLSCGVCGANISEVVSRDLLFVRTNQQPMVRSKTQVHPRGVVILGAGLGVLVTGIYLLFASGVIGLFLILAGITITAAVLGIEGSFTGISGGSLKRGKRASGQGEMG